MTRAATPHRLRFSARASRDKLPVLPVAEAPAPTTRNGVAVIRLYDVIDSWGGYWGVSAGEFNEALDTLGQDVSEIRLHINSIGGEVFEGIAMLNALRAHPARVTVVVDALAASAASFVALAGDEIVMAPYSQLMIHDAWGGCVGNAEDMRETAGRLDGLSANMASMYADRAGGTVEQWRAAMRAETWFSAEEAVEAGLADRVGGPEDTDPGTEDAAQARFDLGVFRHAGRADAPDPQAHLVPLAQTDGSVFAVGDRVRVTIDPPHEPGQSTGTVAEVGGTAYGVVFDQMPQMGIHRWYTAAEIEPAVEDPRGPQEPQMAAASTSAARRSRDLELLEVSLRV